jgi:hypothetical protein
MMPHELAFSDLYITPVIPALFLAFFVTSITVIILNKMRLSHYFFNPPLSFLAIMTLYLLAIDAWIIPL